MSKSLLILVIIISNTINAQNPINNLNVIGQGNFSSGLWIISNETTNKVKGSTYLFNDWSQVGKVYFNNKIYAVNQLNYNIQLERFEAKISPDSIFAFDRGDVRKIEINDKLFTRYLDPAFRRNTYFENIFIFKDKKLLKKYMVELKEGQLNPMTMQKIQEDRFIKKEQFYILEDGEDELSEFKLKKKNILSLIEDVYKPKVKEFAKDNRLNYNNVEDLTKIFNYYNALIQ